MTKIINPTKQLFYTRLIERGYKKKFLQHIFDKQYNRQQIINQIMTRYQNKKEKLNDANNNKPFIRLPQDIRIKKLKYQIRQCLKPDKNIKQDIHYNDIFPTGNIRTNMITNKSLALYLTQSK